MKLFSFISLRDFLPSPHSSCEVLGDLWLAHPYPTFIKVRVFLSHPKRAVFGSHRIRCSWQAARAARVAGDPWRVSPCLRCRSSLLPRTAEGEAGVRGSARRVVAAAVVTNLVARRRRRRSPRRCRISRPVTRTRPFACRVKTRGFASRSRGLSEREYFFFFFFLRRRRSWSREMPHTTDLFPPSPPSFIYLTRVF